MEKDGQITREIRGKRTYRIWTNAEAASGQAGWARRRIEQLVGRIDDLQRELARAKAEATTAAEERDELPGQLEAASHNLLLTEQRQSPKPGRVAERLGSDEQALLYELRGQRRRPGSAG